jgi:hypothetical protein
VIWLLLPSIYHKSTAEKMAPHLRDGQTIIINPTAPLGPIEFERALRASGCSADITIAATCTLLFAARLKEPGRVFINGQKIDVARRPTPLPNARAEALTRPFFPNSATCRTFWPLLRQYEFRVPSRPHTAVHAMIEKGRTSSTIGLRPQPVKLIEAITRRHDPVQNLRL